MSELTYSCVKCGGRIFSSYKPTLCPRCQSSENIYDADYFLRGQELGISGYTDYRWMPELTIPMVTAMVSHLHIEPSDTILDFGCARGYVVRAFREMGYDAFGYDISQWALDNADCSVKKYLIHNEQAPSKLWVQGAFSWVIAKDVLEHIENITPTISGLMKVARKGVFAVVPLASYMGGRYCVEEYEKDVTHIHRMPLAGWVALFHRPGWSVEARYRVCGVKDNYSQYPTGNGFITARRLE